MTMAIAQRLASLAEVAQVSNTSERFAMACRDFLDGFYEAPTEEKLRPEPPKLAPSLEDEGYADAYLAAMAEYLAHRYRMKVPVWSRGPGRIANRPAFAMDSYEGRMFLLVESPAEFRARNIFISADGLTRV
jgi:hypothetical protein